MQIYLELSILIEVLLCNIEYCYELRFILMSQKGKSKYKKWVKILSDTLYFATKHVISYLSSNGFISCALLEK